MSNVRPEKEKVWPNTLSWSLTNPTSSEQEAEYNRWYGNGLCGKFYFGTYFAMLLSP